MRSQFTRLRLSVAALLLVAGCSNGPNVVEPVNFGMTAEQKAQADALKDAKDAAKARFKAEKGARKAEFEAARDAWKLFKKGIEIAKKNGNLASILLRCEPQEYDGDAEVIGPNGGHIKLGENELRIPKGALDHDVLITMERPVSQLVEVVIQPHGLHFAKDVELELSYSHCVQPPHFRPFIVYLDDTQETILEVEWSTDKKGLKTVTGFLEHFSRYAVAY
jgi:hypothetical protein